MEGRWRTQTGAMVHLQLSRPTQDQKKQVVNDAAKYVLPPCLPRGAASGGRVKKLKTKWVCVAVIVIASEPPSGQTLGQERDATAEWVGMGGLRTMHVKRNDGLVK